MSEESVYGGGVALFLLLSLFVRKAGAGDGKRAHRQGSQGRRTAGSVGSVYLSVLFRGAVGKTPKTLQGEKEIDPPPLF